MMTVYRIEHKDGYGPFIMGYSKLGYLREHNIHDQIPQMAWRHESLMPTPDEEGLPFGDDYLCAYRTKEHLMDFIYHEEIEQLVALGYSIFRLEIQIPDRQVGSAQVVFKTSQVRAQVEVTKDFLDF